MKLVCHKKTKLRYFFRAFRGAPVVFQAGEKKTAKYVFFEERDGYRYANVVLYNNP